MRLWAQRDPMKFEEKYSLLELIEDADATIYLATEIPTGKRVSVFLFPGEQTRVQKDMLLQLRSVNRLQFPELVEVGDYRGTTFVVTQPIGGLPELKARLSRIRAASPISPNPESAELSKAGAEHVAGAHASTSGETGKIPAEPQAGQPTAETAGSFTQMFQAASHPIKEPGPEISEIRPPQRQQSKPGSFTQMFEASSPPIGEPTLKDPKDSSTTSPASPPVQAAPGEFTRFFSAASTTKPASEPQNRESQDEFANIFKSGENSGTPPASATGPQAGEFTRIFGKTSIKEDQVPFPAEQTPAQSTPAKNSPGEYTRLFGAQQLPQKPEAASVQAPVSDPEAAAPPKGNSLLIPILIGIILFLLAVLAIVVFASLK